MKPKRLALLLALIGTVSALTLAQEPLSKELTALQGRWLITHHGGQPVPPGSPEGAFMVKGDEYVQGVAGRVVERGRLKIDGSKKPMTVDFIITAGPYANTTQLGIVEIAGDTVTFHVSPPGSKERQADFKPREGAELVTAKRRAQEHP